MLYVGNRDPNLGVKKRTIERRLAIGPVSIKLVVVALLIVFSFFYLFQSNESTKRYYTISDLQEQKEKTEAVKAQLEVDANRLKALSIIQDEANKKGMEPISK